MTRVSTFTYRAIRPDGASELGAVDAQSRDEVSANLVRRGLFPVEIRLAAEGSDRQVRISVQDLALGLRVLATLLESGLPVAKALHTLDTLVPPSWQRALPVIRDGITEGKSLATALQCAPLDIPPLVIGMIRAGEAGSGIGSAIRRAADFMESAAATKRAIRSALAYPLLLAAAGAASTALLVGVVLPRFEAILIDLGQSIPPTTRIILSVAMVARASAIPGLIAAIVIGIAWRAWVGTESGLEKWHRILLSMPVLGAIRRSAGTARVSSALSALLQSGVPVAPAMVHAARAAGDAALAVDVHRAREAVLEGSGLARALELQNALTPSAIRLVRAGEETGEVAVMLDHVAKLEGERAEHVVKAAVRLLEPSLIIIFGGIVSFVAAALLQAVYSVRPGS